MKAHNIDVSYLSSNYTTIKIQDDVSIIGHLQGAKIETNTIKGMKPTILIDGSVDISGKVNTTDISVNKFVTSFEFLQEDDEVGSESYLSNETSYNFNDASSLKYRTRRNKKTDFTEFYNLIYEYKNDCLTASIQYNKDYYSDNELKPTEEIFFSISIVPLATLNTPSVR